MKAEEGVRGALAPPPPPPEANRMKTNQIKWKLLLFDESDFFSFEASLFFILPQIKKRVFFKKNKPDYQMVRPKRMYNLCLVKKAKLEISGRHR